MKLIQSGRTEEALDQLEEHRSQYPANTQKAMVVLKAAWINVKSQQQMGLISYEEAERTHNRINLGILNVGQDIDLNGGGHNINLNGINNDLLNEQTAAIVQRIEKGEYNTVSRNKVQVGKAENVILGSGNTITTKVHKGWGILQYGVLLIAMSGLGFGGWYAFKNLDASAEGIMFSLSKIRADIELLADNDSAVKSAFNEDIEKELDKGWADLQSGNTYSAILHLKSVAEVAPAPKLLLQLGLAYRKDKQENFAQSYMLKAFEKSPALKKEYVESLKGKRMNLLDITAGASIVTASDKDLEGLIYGSNTVSGTIPCEATYAFGNNGSATFDQFQLRIDQTHYYNPKHIELYTADSPNGVFKKLTSITTVNAFTAGNFQIFPFPATTAKYFKIKVLDTHGGGIFGFVGEIKLMGKL